MIVPGDIRPRRDTNHELYVAVLSNTIHLAAGTGRVITCPFIAGRVPADAMAGQTIHLIIEATDDGAPALTRYQRVVVTVTPIRDD